jgi:glycosyltransferase involved in cell wall biosynthesis
MTGGAAKREVLARARFLVFPVRWEEPFGLAVTEALASGCYVLATPYGSLPEIVTRNVGMLSARGADLLEAARHPQKFSPEACRERVLKGGFTHLDMAKNYLAYYERIVARGRLGPEGAEPPQTVAGFFANRLLPWES